MTLLERGGDSPPSPPSIPGASFVPALRSGIYAAQGARSRMEDAHVAIDDISSMTSGRALCHPQAFYGVFDGHGGVSAADHVKEVLLGRVVGDLQFPACIRQALVNAFLAADDDLERMWRSGGEDAIDAGTTALAALVVGRTLYVANAGDCRAVISRRGKAVDVTLDHRPVSAAERARVLAAGGVVVDDGESGYLNGELAVTRALGDWHMQDLKWRIGSDGASTTAGPLIAEPEVFEAELNETDEFMVLACDGLWDAFQGRSQEVISLARRLLSRNNDPLQCSKDLVHEAILRSATDNITVVTICFSSNPPPELTRRAFGVNGTPRLMRRNVSVEALSTLQGILRDA